MERFRKYSVSWELKVGQFNGKPISPALQCTKNICIENRNLCGQSMIFSIPFNQVNLLWWEKTNRMKNSLLTKAENSVMRKMLLLINIDKLRLLRLSLVCCSENKYSYNSSSYSGKLVSLLNFSDKIRTASWAGAPLDMFVVLKFCSYAN